MRIDKQLEKKQVERDLQKRFDQIFWGFDSQDLQNPVTHDSILQALNNIKRELNVRY